MSLLADLMTSDALDPGYADAARGDGTRARPPRTARLLFLAVLTAVGVLLATAVTQQQKEEPAAESQRQRLVTEVEERTEQADRLQRELARVRREAARARSDSLAHSAAGNRVEARLRALALAVGEAPVTGSGIRVTVDDAAAANDAGSSDGASASRVLDRDLQKLVNALWAAGAGAVAVNGQRLTAVTAIRAAGDAILVDYRPVKPPYVVTAIGDPEALRVRFADSRAGRLFRTLEATFGIGFDVERGDRLRLPGASTLTLHYAREVRDT